MEQLLQLQRPDVRRIDAGEFWTAGPREATAGAKDLTIEAPVIALQVCWYNSIDRFIISLFQLYIVFGFLFPIQPKSTIKEQHESPRRSST